MKVRIAIAVAALLLLVAPSAHAAFGFQPGSAGFEVKAADQNGAPSGGQAPIPTP